MSYRNCVVKKCTMDDIDSIMFLQEQIFSGLKDRSVLRENDRDGFAACLQEPNIVLGVFNEKKELVAIGIVFDGKGTKEDLSIGLQLHTVNVVANLKLVLVREDYRGRGFQKALMWLLEKWAYSVGYTHLCTTVAQNNMYSLDNMLAMGYEYDHSEVKYGGLERNVYVKDIESSVKAYNKLILENASSIEGLKEEKDLILEGVELNKCIEGTPELLKTGDILEYLDVDNGRIYYALFMKTFSPMIVIYSREDGELKIQDYDTRIGTKVLRRALLNTVKGV